MARARNIKPGLFKNEILGVADPLYTLLFEGLWVLADREGRMEDRPLRIKAEVFPYRDGLNVDEMLNWLQDNGFIVRDLSGSIQIVNRQQWYDEKTPAQVNAEGAARRARRRKAMPTWAHAGEIKAVYEAARLATQATGQEHHVDHIVPLAGALVCGLHVAANLQVIPAVGNLKKSNKFEVSHG